MTNKNSFSGNNNSRSFQFGKLFDKVVRIFLVASYLLASTHPTPVRAATILTFAGYGSENLSSDSGYWDLSSAALGSGIFSFSGTVGTAQAKVDVSTIGTAIDLGGMEIAFSIQALIGNETPLEEQDGAAVEIGFGLGSLTPDSTVTLSRSPSNLGANEELISNASIPSGTRYLFIKLIGTGNGTSNTVQFSAPSLMLNDNQKPTLTYTLSPSGWTNSDVLVTLVASDEDSGIEGIYDSLNNRLLVNTFSTAVNGSWTFYCKDNAGKTSDTLTVDVTAIDKLDPGQVELTVGTTEWSKTAVKFSLSEVSSGTGESPVTRQYRLNSGGWQEYTTEVTVSQEGSTFIEARAIDAAGNDSDIDSATVRVDTSAPTILASAVAHPQSQGGATISITISDAITSVAQAKYDVGSYDAAHFATEGETLSANSMEVVSGGAYTFYAADPLGNEAVFVLDVNTYPRLDAISDQSLNEDNTSAINFNVSDYETTAGSLTVTAVSDTPIVLPNPAISNSAGAITLTLAPALNQSGLATVTVSVTDGGGLVTSTDFEVTVAAVNDIPLAGNDSASTAENTLVVIYVLENDSDVENEALTVTAVTTPPHGTAVITGDGTTIAYTPSAHTNGTDSFTYTVTDASGGSRTADVTVSISNVNDPPSGVNDSATLLEDTPTTLDVLANDQDIDLETNPADEHLTIKTVTDPAHGSAVISENKILYTPDANYNGSDSFGYTLEDVAGASSSATVNLTITSANDLPQFTNLLSEYTVDEDNSITVDFLVGDVETVTEALMLQVVSNNQSKVANGKLVISGLGDTDPATSLTITPEANQNGDVIITVKLGDGFEVNTVTFTLHITPVNDAPEVAGDSYPFEEDHSITIDLHDLVGNDSDIDGDPLVVDHITVDSGTFKGTLTELDPVEKTYRYDPPANFDGSTSFEATISDGQVTRTSLVTLTATPVNDPPVLTMNPANPTTTNEDTPVTIDFTIFDWETSTNLLALQAGSSNSDLVAPNNMVITRQADGSCSMQVTPSQDKNGPVTLTISLSDGTFLVEKTIVLTINAVQDAPVAVNDVFSIDEGGTLIFSPLINDYDVDGETISLLSINLTDLEGKVINNGDGTLTYTAPNQFSGSDQFTYTIGDGIASATATVTFNVNLRNLPPEITAIANQFIDEDNSSAALAFQVSDPNAGDALTVTATSSNIALVSEDETHLILTESPLGSGSYTIRVVPLADANGTTTVTLTVKDSGDKTAAITFDVTVFPVNDPPVATADLVTTDEDTSVTFNPLSNDSDLETAIHIIAITDPQHGHLSYAAGTYTYMPNTNFYGSDEMTYTITDGETSVMGTIEFTINPVNDTPTANNDWIEIPNTINATSAINVLGNDHSNGDSGETLHIVTIVSGPTYGTAVIENGKVTYTRTSAPTDSRDSFVYRIGDGVIPEKFATATVYIAEDWAPSIYADNVWVAYNEDSPGFDITVPISDGYGGGLTLELLDTPTLGTATVPSASGKIIHYTPNANANGSENFRYKITSLSHPEISSTARVYITLYSVNDLPTITTVVDQTIYEDTSTGPLDVEISDVDTEHPAAGLIFTAYADVADDLVLQGGISFSRSGGAIDLTITPIANRFGTTTITLLASDGIGSTTTTFELTVTPVNDPPQAEDKSIVVYEDNETTLSLVTPNADLDGDKLSVSLDTPPAHGTATVNLDKTVTYVPNTNYDGTDSFIYLLSDGNGGSDTGTVSITILPANDPPAISNLVYSHETLEDTPVNVTLTLADIDTDWADRTVSFASNNSGLLPVANIVMSGSGDNKTLALTPKANQFGTAIITVTLSDGQFSVSQDFQLVVAAVNDLPAAAKDTANTDEDTPVTIAVTSNDTDIEDSTLTVASFTNPAHGTVSNPRNGSLIYSPAENWNGSDSFSYTIVDSNDGRASATVEIEVAPVNDAPLAATDTVSTPEDTDVTINLLANDSDVEGSTIILTGVGTPAKGSLVNHGDGTVTYTPNFDFYGQDTFSYTISDGELTSNGEAVVNITAVNDAPRVTSSEPRPWVFNEDVPSTFPINIYDPETPSDNLVIKISSTDQTIVKDTSITLSGSGQNKQIRFAPQPNKYGTLNIRIEATDGVLTTVVLYEVQVLSVNDLPVISVIANQTIVEDTSTSVIGFTVTDVETGAASLTVTAASGDEILFPLSGITLTNSGGSSRTVQVQPAANRNGTGTITLTVTDGNGESSTRAFNVTVTPLNDPPLAVADNTSTDEDSPVSISVLTNDSDTDLALEGDVLTIVSADNVSHGTVDLATDKKSLTYTPAANWNGTETFTYTIRDNANARSTASVKVVVSPVNDAPSAVDDTATVNEDNSVQINVLGNDEDPDLAHEGDTLTILSAGVAAHGTVTVATDKKNLTYSPAADWSGTDTFTYIMQDKNSIQSNATVTVTVNPVNDAPTISDVTDRTINEDSDTGTISFTVNDVDDPLAGLSVTGATSDGAIVPTENISIANTGGGNRTVTVTPLANQNTWVPGSPGHDAPLTITLTVSDTKLTASDTFTLSVTPVNDNPTAVDDPATVNEDGSVVVSVLTNDTDVDLSLEGDTRTVVSLGTAGHGTPTITGSGATVTYAPEANWSGTDTFTYTMQDKNSVQSSATVTVTVNPVNDAPTISDVSNQTINEDSNTGAISFTVNDVDNDLAGLTVTAATNNGTVVPLGSMSIANTGGGNRTVTVTPLANQNTWVPGAPGHDAPLTITLTVSDTKLTASDTFTLSVTPVNDNPTAVDDSATVNEDNSVVISVLTNDTDVDLGLEGDTRTVVSVGTAGHGTPTITGSGATVTYAPEANWSGTDTFTYTMQDKNSIQSSATVTVTVNPVNDAPSISDVSNQTINEDSNTGAISFTVNDVDDPLAGLTVTAATSNGTVVPLGSISIANTGGGNRTVTVTPLANQNTWVPGSPGHDAPLTITLTVSDTKLTASDTFTLSVTPVNDNPTAVDDPATVNEDNSVVISVLTNDTDVDLGLEGDTRTVVSVGTAGHGTPTITGSGATVTYAPEANWSGTDTFTYTMQDKNSIQSSATVTVTVNPVNDAPTISDVSNQTINEDGNTGAISFTVNDVDDPLAGLTVTGATSNGAVVPLGSISIANTGAGNRTVTVTPLANQNTWVPGSPGHDAPLTITLTVSDTKLTASDTFTLSVTPVNDNPTAVDDPATVNEDNSVVISVLTNDTDVDLGLEGDTRTVVSVGTAGHGTPTITGSGATVTYAPEANWSGTDTFTYTMQDKNSVQSSATVTVTVNPVNDAPTISDVSNQTINEDSNTGAISFTVNDVDDPLAGLTVTATSSNGAVVPVGNISIANTGAGNRTVTVTPLANQNTWVPGAPGHDAPLTITLTVSDTKLTASDTFTLSVTPLNDGPTAVDDPVTIDEDSSAVISVLTNDTDVDLSREGDVLSIVSIGAVANGTATITGSGTTITYIPNTNYNGLDTFTYTMQDSHGAQSSASVKVTVGQLNDAPTISDVSNQTINEDSNTGAISFTVNDVDNDLAGLTVTAATGNGTVVPLGSISIVNTGAGNRTVTVTPLADENTWVPGTPGHDAPLTITLTVSDGSLTASDSRFTLSVTPLNDGPIAVNDGVTMDEDNSRIISVLTNDTDVDLSREGDVLSIVSIGAVANGTATITGSGTTITYTPTPNWNGTEIFTYIMRDKDNLQSNATVTVTVNGTNDPPTISDVPDQTVNEDGNSGAIAFTVGDIDNSPASLTVTATTGNGTVCAPGQYRHYSRERREPQCDPYACRERKHLEQIDVAS